MFLQDEALRLILRGNLDGLKWSFELYGTDGKGRLGRREGNGTIKVSRRPELLRQRRSTPSLPLGAGARVWLPGAGEDPGQEQSLFSRLEATVSLGKCRAKEDQDGPGIGLSGCLERAPRWGRSQGLSEETGAAPSLGGGR